MRQTVRLVIASAVAIVCSGALGAEKVTVTFKDACHCIKCHAEYRWDVKTDDDDPPANVTNELTPSDIGDWSGPGGIFTQDTPRKAKEKKFFALTDASR
jgi:hypothetical protein